jgi:phage anti-repressor protein
MEFNLVQAQSLYSSTDQYPVDFDQAWQWLDYSRKDAAKRVLLNSGFIEGTDFHINEERRENISSSHFGGKQVTEVEVISLTVDCLKLWAMMAGTQKGKEVRLYFLECEKIAKARVVQPLVIKPYISYIQDIEALKFLGFENDLNLKQLIRDKMEDELSTSLGKSKALVKAPEYTIVKVRATELGYSTGDIGNGSALGKFVAKLVPVSYEQRVGKYSVKHYLVSDQLDTAIKSYFGMITS